MNRYRWAWFILACLVAAGWAWTTRYEYRDCHRGVCVAVDRWTGEIYRAETAAVAARRERAARDQARWDSLTALGQDTATIGLEAGPIEAPADDPYQKIAEKYARGGQ